MKRLLFLAALASCAPPEQEQGEPARIEERGRCAPAAERVMVPSFNTTCLRAGPVQLVTDAATLAAAFDCEPPSVDFTTHRALLVPAQQGGVEGFVLPNFIARGQDHFELGVIIRRLGAVPSSSVLLLPLTPAHVEVATCESVCVEGCDRPIPAAPANHSR